MNDLTLLSEVEFASFLNYSPRGTSQTAINSRIGKDLLKSCSPPERLEAMVARLSEYVPGSGLQHFLGPTVGLIPAPRASQIKDGALWPAKTLCELLVKYSLGAEVHPIIERHTSIRASKNSPGNRPEPIEHLATIQARAGFLPYSAVTIVDDITTRGSTLLACASLVSAQHPKLKVRAFAFQRTLGLQPDIERLIEIVCGRLRYDSVTGNLSREP